MNTHGLPQKKLGALNRIHAGALAIRERLIDL